MNNIEQKYSVLSPVTKDRRYEQGEHILLSCDEARPLLAAGIISAEPNGASPTNDFVGEFLARLAVMSESDIGVMAREIGASDNLTYRLSLLLEASQMVGEAGFRAQRIRAAVEFILAKKAPDTITKAGMPTLAALRTETGLDDLTKTEVDVALDPGPRSQV